MCSTSVLDARDFTQAGLYGCTRMHRSHKCFGRSICPQWRDKLAQQPHSHNYPLVSLSGLCGAWGGEPHEARTAGDLSPQGRHHRLLLQSSVPGLAPCGFEDHLEFSRIANKPPQRLEGAVEHIRVAITPHSHG